eukprot:GHRQ01034862.1.p1 GENE.GHRQ01034862.1~~GHRQ01034862.1.p1  ORF type:complete len:105 (-),score=24.72 GHRQ01034862.1:155-469(-)
MLRSALHEQAEVSAARKQLCRAPGNAPNLCTRPPRRHVSQRLCCCGVVLHHDLHRCLEVERLNQRSLLEHLAVADAAHLHPIQLAVRQQQAAACSSRLSLVWKY